MIKPDKPDSQGIIKLDMRPSPKMGKELANEINESVQHTQLFVMQPLPSVLVVTQKQFASLQDYTEQMYYTTDRMFKATDTSGNILAVMEVQIDRDIDILEEVERALREVDEAKQQDDNNPTDEPPKV